MKLFNLINKLYKIKYNIYIKLNNLTDKSKIKVLNEIIEKFYYQIDDDKYFLNSSELLVKKVTKNQDLLKNNYLHKFLSEEINDKLKENYDKFINWFIS